MGSSVALINPAAAHGIYGDLGSKLIAVEPPTWLRLIAGNLRNRQSQEIATLDAEQGCLSADEVARWVQRIDPRYVALVVFGHMPSATTQQMFGAREVATAIKKLEPGRKIVILGGHVSALPEQTLLEEPVDYAVKGEGPITLARLLNGDEPRAIPGLVWRRADGGITVNPPATALDPDRDLSDQAWDLTPPANYTAHNWQALGYPNGIRKPYASIVTSFNCPYRCHFCQINTPFGGSGYKTRSAEAVIDEIEMLHRDHGVHFFKFVDEMYLLKPSHYLPIAQGLIDRGLGDKINCWVYGRVDSVKPETLILLRRSGVRWIALGIESGDPDIRDGADKRLKENDIVGIVREIQNHDISVVGNFMFGFRNDTLATMQATLDLALECLPEWANFYCTMALPGSKLYEQALREGWTLPSSWRGYSQHNDDCRPLDTLHVDAATVLRFRDEAFRTYFSAPSYQRMIEHKFGTDAVTHVNEMLQYRLKRKLLA